MFTGIIKTKDVVSHPILLIQMKGVGGFFRILYKALSRKDYHFVDCLGIPKTHLAERKTRNGRNGS